MSEITIFRAPNKANFTVINRLVLEDERLTWEARGLLAFLLAKPDFWKIILTNLVKSSPAGDEKNRRILNELINNKYIKKENNRNNQGQFSTPNYKIFELPYDGFLSKKTDNKNRSKINSNSPKPLKLSLVKPDTENPSAVNPSLIKTQVNKDTNKTTTTSNEFVWPDNIDASEKLKINSISKNEDPVVVQQILYEIAAQSVFIKGPVNMFYGLLKLDKKGEFFPSVSRRTKSKNDEKEKGEKHYKSLLEASERRALKVLKLKSEPQKLKRKKEQ